MRLYDDESVHILIYAEDLFIYYVTVMSPLRVVKQSRTHCTKIH